MWRDDPFFSDPFGAAGGDAPPTDDLLGLFDDRKAFRSPASGLAFSPRAAGRKAHADERRDPALPVLDLGWGEGGGTFRSLGKLGEGSFGETYLVVDARDGHEYALKLLKGGGGEGRSTAEELRREVAILESLSRAPRCIPHVVCYHGAYVVPDDDDDGEGWRYGILTDYVAGESLQDAVDGGRRFSTNEVLEILADLLVALRSVHEAGFAHRDVKLSNVMLAAAGGIVLIDFGLSCTWTDGAAPSCSAGPYGATPLYLLAGSRSEARMYQDADIRAAAAIAYALLSRNGRRRTPAASLLDAWSGEGSDTSGAESKLNPCTADLLVRMSHAEEGLSARDALVILEHCNPTLFRPQHL